MRSYPSWRTHGDDRIIIGSKEGMAIAFHESDVRPMGRVAVGVRGIKLRPGDEVIALPGWKRGNMSP